MFTQGFLKGEDGGFSCPQQLDDSLDCIRGLKALHRIKAMSEGVAVK